ncbi:MULTISPECIES: pyridoxal 5'-phosphate synthase glutaminase subunit PdxT [unclassified Exiguobacterium]|uniref:pyridoxal 5'-phosphate synthase glutaminase subunit PdxT n=1 Tax=unclassified Exiguobacterium TaxID=2644629 RepID=UPI00103FBDB9|nr:MULTISPECIES: pyridoxal 5'-phosphate synthase glutaminase subunit PdxT [unclassified Exiguobacterium]TCI32992.1 pyridoxal 5'-phosphate synthase glutaminase subunit PdxT [Exiguobacterium sp. SH4S7]TCI58581.1 pyridoxal 5'-phosphate synthase glutaminase subunit PdxT [Exiguobacterium sp. SH0S2]
MTTIGVLGMQGAIREHVRMLEALGADTLVVRSVDDLDRIDGLVLPGGESTAMRRLLDRYDLLEPLRANTSLPMFGTCAGLILLATEVEGYDAHLRKIPMIVKRNAFGRQVDSFEVDLPVKGLDDAVEAVFIRAPQVAAVDANVEVLAEVEEAIVAVRYDKYVACSFHPELTDDLSMHRYFLEIVKATKHQLA